MDINALMSNRFVMPSMPRVVAQLLVELARPEPSLRRVDMLISADPALTARVLQAANAASFRLAGHVSCVSEALALLRLEQVHTMVSTVTAQASFRSVPGLEMPKYWTYSLDCAKVARSLANLVRLDHQAAYTCGLIHAVGELAMRMAIKQAVNLDVEAGPLDFRRERAERHAFGFCYTEVSAWLARQWHLPTHVIAALEFAHAPFASAVYDPLTGVVHLAVWRARARQAGLTENQMTVSFPAKVADVLGLDIDMVLQQDPIDWSLQVPGRPILVPPV